MEFYCPNCGYANSNRSDVMCCMCGYVWDKRGYESLTGQKADNSAAPKKQKGENKTSFFDSHKKSAFGKATEIKDREFEFRQDIKSIVIPNGVTKIGDKAFYYCERLIYIKIPEGVTEIGDCAFSNCKSLVAVELPESVTKIGRCAFENCEKLTTVRLPKNLDRVEWGAFRECHNLVDINLSENITSIEEWAFTECGFGRMVIPANVKEIGPRAFLRCRDLKKLTIMPGVETIGDSAFYDCQKLTEVEIPDSVTEIGDRAFGNCKNLVSVEIPDSVKHMETSAFEGCDILYLETLKIMDDSIADAEARKEYAKEYAYLTPYYLQYQKKHPDCSFKDYVSWAKDYTPGNYATPEADPDFDRNNEAIRGCCSSARCLAKNGEGYITIWQLGI